MRVGRKCEANGLISERKSGIIMPDSMRFLHKNRKCTTWRAVCSLYEAIRARDKKRPRNHK